MSIEQSTLDFLAELEKNNDKEWFDVNRKRYQAAKKNMEAFVQELLNELARFEPELAAADPKKCIFRIFRDVRFSNDKRPYKTNMGAYMSKGGRKSPDAGFYLHVQPGNCFIAGGVYMPPTPMLTAIRQEIDYNTDEFKAIINNKQFKKLFGEIQGEQLKTAPKNYSKDHPEIELLRYKSYLAVHNVTDKQAVAKNYKDKVIETYEAMVPLIRFLNRATD